MKSAPFKSKISFSRQNCYLFFFLHFFFTLSRLLMQLKYTYLLRSFGYCWIQHIRLNFFHHSVLMLTIKSNRSFAHAFVEFHFNNFFSFIEIKNTLFLLFFSFHSAPIFPPSMRMHSLSTFNVWNIVCFVIIN